MVEVLGDVREADPTNSESVREEPSTRGTLAVWTAGTPALVLPAIRPLTRKLAAADGSSEGSQLPSIGQVVGGKVPSPDNHSVDDAVDEQRIGRRIRRVRAAAPCGGATKWVEVLER